VSEDFEYVDIARMAQLLGVSVPTLRRAYLRGEVRAHKLGKVLRFIPHEVREDTRAAIESKQKRPP